MRDLRGAKEKECSLLPGIVPRASGGDCRVIGPCITTEFCTVISRSKLIYELESLKDVMRIEVTRERSVAYYS